MHQADLWVHVDESVLHLLLVLHMIFHQQEKEERLVELTFHSPELQQLVQRCLVVLLQCLLFRLQMLLLQPVWGEEKQTVRAAHHQLDQLLD
jgi:hypothetical protein